MTNRIKEAHDALATVVQAAFPDATHHRNPKGDQDWLSNTFAVVLTDDKQPETDRVMSGAIYDLRALPRVLFARRLRAGEREADEWADVETLKAALAADVTLGGAVEDARPETVEDAELDTSKWLGGGLEVTVRLLFNAPSAAG